MAGSEFWPKRGDPALGKCNVCGRKTWIRYSVGRWCGMTQPDGKRCGGSFIPAGAVDVASDDTGGAAD